MCIFIITIMLVMYYLLYTTFIINNRMTYFNIWAGLLFFITSGCFSLLFGDEDWVGFVHTREGLYYWAISPAHISSFIHSVLLLLLTLESSCLIKILFWGKSCVITEKRRYLQAPKMLDYLGTHPWKTGGWQAHSSSEWWVLGLLKTMVADQANWRWH